MSNSKKESDEDVITVERAAIGDRTKTNNYAHAALVWWQFAALRRRVRRCTIEVARGGVVAAVVVLRAARA
ncbi:MAG: hypothetical protein M3Q91_01730 [Acidobacteriota bacterium]|nr:hypothetical protein [Acidobacteriota bacterium]